MAEARAAPWVVEGEAIAALVRWPGRRAALPAGVVAVPGPSLVLAVACAASPVGPFLELVVAQPARLGVRVGWCFSCSVVDNAAMRLGARENWGFPHQLGSLVWSAAGDERTLRWVERGLTVSAVRSGTPVPWLLPLRALQRRADGPVIVPGRLRGRGHVASVSVEVADRADDALGGLAGAHHGVVVGSLRYRLAPARHPWGATGSLLAPLRAPEPAVVR